MLRKVLDWLGGWMVGHVADILAGGTFLVIVGFVIGFAGQMGEMVGLFPAPFAVACLSAYGLGVISHMAFTRISAALSKRRYLRMVMDLPVPTKEVLREAYEEGKIWGNIRDPSIRQLYELGVLEGPPHFELLRGDAFAIKPKANAFIRDNRDAIFKDLPSQANGEMEQIRSA